MSSLRYKVRGNSPQGKPRVYFCCHKDDFEKYFEEISEDILNIQSCAIWYRNDFTNADNELENDLKMMQLFVIPITAKFLTTNNSALDYEFKIAIDHHIPILPLLMEPGLEQLFNHKCGNIQFLKPHFNDVTEISYEKKLKNYLESILIGNELAEKIRNAFDAYIFLSYRKKDRKYAQELMRLIHNNEFCRDIAIWYDEFLTPGENFNDSIKEALLKSDLFVLTVTPNLVNEVNYVITTEYPMAKEQQKPILPVELVKTNKNEVLNKFEGIILPINVHDEKQLSGSILENIKKIAITENNTSPEHMFFIGLAYLNGIDVEVNRERALSLIRDAANNNLPEAMKKLSSMYHDGEGVSIDYKQSVYWAEKHYHYYKDNFGESHLDTLTSLSDLAIACGNAGEYEKQKHYHYIVYKYREALLGKKHMDTLVSLSNYARALTLCGNREEAIIYAQTAAHYHSEVLGEEHPSTLQAITNCGFAFSKWNRHHHNMYDCFKTVYDIRKNNLGEEHPDTMEALGNLAIAYDFYEEYDTRFEILEKVYEFHKIRFGEEHPITITTLFELADCHFKMHHYKEGLDLNAKVCEVRKTILGMDHPETIKAYDNIEFMYRYIENHHVDIDLYKAIYDAKCRVIGSMHYKTIDTLYQIADLYQKMGDKAKEREYRKMADKKMKKIDAYLCKRNKVTLLDKIMKHLKKE